MSERRPSRTDIIYRQPARTVAQLIASIERDSELSAKSILDRCSAIRRVTKALGREPDSMSVIELSSSLTRLSPASCGVRPRTFESYLSKVRQALIALRADIIDTRKVVMAPEWLKLFERVPDEHTLKACGRFARWATVEGVAPDAVDQATADSYGSDLAIRMSSTKPDKGFGSFCRGWNTAAERYPNVWPQVKLDPGNRRKASALPESQIAEHFVADMDAMLSCFGDPLRLPKGFESQYEESTLAEMRRIYLRLYSIAVRHHAPITSMADLVRVPVAHAVLAHYCEMFGKDNNKSVHKYAHFLFLAAKYWAKSEPADIDVLHQWRRNTRPENTGMTAQNRAMLRSFDDDSIVGKFLRQGENAAAKFKRIANPSYRDALELQIAMAIELLIAAPVRPQNLSAIDLSRHLVQQRSGKKETMHLVFTASEVKNDCDLDFMLTPRACEILRLYLSRARPMLAQEGTTFLFPGYAARHKGPGLLSKQIAARTLRLLGVRVTGHRFRHVVGYLYLRENPNGHEVVRRFLGHKSITTTIRHYAGMEQSTAVKTVHGFIQDTYERLFGTKKANGRRRINGDDSSQAQE